MSTSETVALIGLAIGLLSFLLTLLEKWHLVASAYQRLARIVKVRPAVAPAETAPAEVRPAEIPLGRRFAVSRRSFLLISTGFAGAMLYYLLRAKDWTFTLIDSSHADAFIVNNESGTVHHAVVCRDHLPSSASPFAPSSEIDRGLIHHSKLPEIAGVIAKQSSDAFTEDLLLFAIEASPTSTHLYRPLLGLWGKRRDYERIHEFLAVTIERLRANLRASGLPPSVTKAHEKAIRDLQMRKQRAEAFAAARAIR